MSRFWACLIGSVFIVGMHQVANAERLRGLKVAHWVGGAYSYSGTRRFSHCSAGASYLSGVTLFFAVTRNYQWSVAFAAPNFNVVPGQNIKIALSIDGDAPSIVTAYAIDNKLIRIDLSPTAEIFNKFRLGNLLRLTAKDVSYTFNLSDTSQLLPVLLHCVSTALNPPRLQPSVIPETTAVSQTTGKVGKENRLAEATAILANMLSMAGVTGFQVAPVSEDEIEATADAVWSAGNISGALFITESPEIKKASDTSPMLVSMAAKACKGSFFSGATPDEMNRENARVITSCRAGASVKSLYFLTTSRKKGGYYIFLTMTDGSETPAKETDANIRAAVFKMPAK